MKTSTPVPVRHHRFRLAQGTLFWHEAGRGDTVLFLHGTWQDSSQWYPLLQTLAQDFHCIAPDLLGFGESSATSASHSIALEVESLEALMSHLRVGQVYLVAHSLGAWVALALAQRYPERVKGVLVIEPEGFMPRALQGRWRLDRWLMAPWSPLAWGLGVLSPLMQRLGARGGLRQWQQRRQRLRSAPVACHLLFRRRWAEIVAELVSTRPDPLEMPLVVVESDFTSATAHHLTQACLATFPQATHQILPGTDHGPDIKPEAICDVLSQVVETGYIYSLARP
jgi:pimeloyl-ACP methyl ester carboxylesterase